MNKKIKTFTGSHYAATNCTNNSQETKLSRF